MTRNTGTPVQEIAGVLHANLQLTEDMAFGCYLYSQTPNKKTGYVPVRMPAHQTTKGASEPRRPSWDGDVRLLRLLTVWRLPMPQDAYFNYDVETAPDRFLKQRRRWFNGIVGGINGEINPFSAIWWKASPKPLHLKLRNFLVMCQQYVLVMQVREASSGANDRP